MNDNKYKIDKTDKINKIDCNLVGTCTKKSIKEIRN